MGRRLRRRRRVLLDLGGEDPGCRLGWQVQHEFSVTQASSSRAALELPPGGVRARHDPRAAPCRQPSSVAVSLQREAASAARGVGGAVLRRAPIENREAADFEQFALVLQMIGTG
jgi:hypothetical protein